MDLGEYYKEISKVPLMSKEEERDLFMDLMDEGIPEKAKQRIRDRIIRSNLRFVFKQAKYFSKNDPSMFEELICAGNEGLLVGLQKYDPDCGVKFLSYAGHWVNQRMWKEMSKMRLVSLPIWKQQLGARIQKEVDYNPNITFEELKKKFPDEAEKDLAELFETKYLTFYIEDMGDHPDFEIDPIGDEVETRIDKERMHETIESLPSPHKEIIFMYFGLKDDDEKTHTEIAAELGLSKDQLREYKKEALDMLREKLEHQI